MSGFDPPARPTPTGSVSDALTTVARDYVLPTHYFQRDDEGNPIETPVEMFRRVARNVAMAEAVAEEDLTLSVTPEALSFDAVGSNRLARKLFGSDTLHGGRREVVVDETTVAVFPYETLYPRLPLNVARRVEEAEAEFFDAMTSLGFVPNSPALSNAGTSTQQLASCFVLAPRGPVPSVMETTTEAALILKSGGGVGYALGYLPTFLDDDPNGRVATFPLRVLGLLDRLPDSVLQSGRRRGAQIGVLPVYHPAIVEFIHAKVPKWSARWQLNGLGSVPLEDSSSTLIDDDQPDHLRNVPTTFLSNFNLSIGVTDQFMSALAADELFTLREHKSGDPVRTTPSLANLYERYNLGNHVEVGEPLQLPAVELWERFTAAAHTSGEPGVLFLDRLQRDHSIPGGAEEWESICATDPCGVQPLTEYESCPLGHVNLSTVVAESGPTWSGQNDEVVETAVADFLSDALDWEMLNRRIDTGIRFLDNTITMSVHPLTATAQRVEKLRKVGLGVMGLAHLLVQLGIKYGSPVGNEVTRQVVSHVNRRSTEASHQLAAERGTFPLWSESKYSEPTAHPEWFRRHTGCDPSEWPDGYPVRNHKTTGVAPCGTTSIVGGTTGGCEPIYEAFYRRSMRTGDHRATEMVDEYFQYALDTNGIDPQRVIAEANNHTDFNLYDLPSVPNRLAELVVTAHEVTPKEHVNVQCACQRGVDSAVSKTCNLPAEATQEDVNRIILQAYHNGAKGITVYRDGGRSNQVLNSGEQRSVD